MSELDIVVNKIFLEQSSFFLEMTELLTNLADPLLVLTLGLLGVIYFAYKRNWHGALVSVISLGGGAALLIFMKNSIMRDRPLGGFIEETGYSFPSGHALMSTILFILIGYLFVSRIQSSYTRRILYVFLTIATAFSAFSRVYLGVHWFSDIVAGIFLGGIWTVLVIILVKHFIPIATRIEK